MADLICIIMHTQIAGSSRQWSSQNHWPWKPRCRHHNLSFILYNNRVMTQNEISVMAALICILLNFPKGASLTSSGFLISTFHRYKSCKKNLMGTPKPRSPTLLLDYTSEDIDLFLHGGHFGRHLGFRTFRMWRKNDTLFFSDVYNHILTESGEFLLLPKNTRNYKWA